jgi:LacI family transcriptional regulator
LASTLRDVAKRSCVSTGTVSRVLNNKMVMPISPETVERIKQAARDLQYSPNAMARALATGRTHTLGLFSIEMTDPHFAQMLEAVEAKASAMGYQVIVSGTLDPISRRERVDGLLALASPTDPQFEGISERLSSIFVYNQSESHSNLVAWSDEEGMGLAVKHLADLGHRYIVGLFCSGAGGETPHPKVLGFRSALENTGIQSVECFDMVKPNQRKDGAQCENGYRATQKLIQEGVPFTAIVARNDFLALGALRALKEAGLSVPQNVSVVGYTDSIHAVCADPPLTSVRTPIAEAGEIAVERLIRSIEDRESTFEGTMLPTTLEVRQSSAPCSGRS